MSDVSREPRRSGRTRAAIDQQQAPRLPHEHDESSDSQASESRKVIRQAHEDLVSGKVDTDRGVPMGEAYRQQKEAPEVKKKERRS